MKFSAKTRILALAVACVSLGAGVSAIANAGAASGHRADKGFGYHHGGFGRFGFRHGFGFGGGAVHGDLVVPTASGGFATVTFDRGTVKNVSGNALTVTDGTRTATYQDVTLTIPTDAKIRNNGATAKLTDLQTGERVLVVQSPKGAFVIAHTLRTGSTGNTGSDSQGREQGGA